MTRPDSFTRDQLLECASGAMFGPGNARLPAPPMLMFDRITEISTDGGRHGRGVGEVKFTGQVLPSAKVVRYEIDVKRVLRGKLRLVIADGRTYVDDRLIYEADTLRVGLFQSTEGF